VSAKKPKCSQRVVSNEQQMACYKNATQRVVMRSRMVHRCEEHELDVELCESHGWSVWKVEAA
jgi:hypothetical protein